jgi:hypothetical protein
VPVNSTGQWTFDNTTTLADSAAKQTTDQRVLGSYGTSGFDFSLKADVTQNIVDDNNYRIDATVHQGRRLWTVGGAAPTLSVDTIDTGGGFGRTNGVLTYADGQSSERWSGLADTGRFYSRDIDTAHGYVTRDVHYG